MNFRVPHLHVVIAFSLLAVGGYAAFSVWVFGWTDDAALRGDVIGTWKSFAVLAFGFWLGSSSAGKAKESEPSAPSNPPSGQILLPDRDTPPEGAG